MSARWLLLAVMAIGLVATACTERLTTPGSCPTFCPGGQAAYRDTVLTPILNGDSSFSGYVEPSSLTSVLVSNGGQYDQHRAVIRFLSRGDSVTVLDTARTFTVDSATIEFGVQDRDTTVSNFVLEFYRLPSSLDSTATFATVDALMTPAALLGEMPLGPALRSGVFHLTLTGAQLALIAFQPGDSTVLQVGVRVRADQPTAARIGTPASGTFAPLFTSFVTANGVSDSLKSTTVARTSGRDFTVAPPSAPPPAGLLAVGGVPVARTFLRFALPEYLRDSATIIRATLNLQTDVPLIGIPADTALLVASALLVDFGSKSPVVPGADALAVLLPGNTGAELEVISLVHLWQGHTPTPSVIRLALAQEGGTFVFPLFRSTRSATGMPTLRITYRPPFAFEGY